MINQKVGLVLLIAILSQRDSDWAFITLMTLMTQMTLFYFVLAPIESEAPKVKFRKGSS